MCEGCGVRGVEAHVCEGCGGTCERGVEAHVCERGVEVHVCEECGSACGVWRCMCVRGVPQVTHERIL